MIDAVAVSPLRRRMIEDMTIRRFGEHTQRDYVLQVRELTAFLGLPPDRAEPEDSRRYQLHLASLGASYVRDGGGRIQLDRKPAYGIRKAGLTTYHIVPIWIPPGRGLLFSRCPETTSRPDSEASRCPLVSQRRYC